MNEPVELTEADAIRAHELPTSTCTNPVPPALVGDTRPVADPTVPTRNDPGADTNPTDNVGAVRTVVHATVYAVRPAAVTPSRNRYDPAVFTP